MGEMADLVCDAWNCWDDWEREHSLADDFFIPSQNAYWYYTQDKTGRSKLPIEDRDDSGKWMIFSHQNIHEKFWEIIKKATEEGRLGYSAKASKNIPSSYQEDENSRLICVYTYNAWDLDDVFRVRAELKKMGFVQKLYYKMNEMTRSGVRGSVHNG